MIEPILFFAAMLLVFLAAQMGMKAGAFPALGRTLAVVVSFFIAMRYWFPVSRLVSGFESSPLLMVSLLVFWTIFLLTFFICLKWCDNYFETFESVQPSILGRILGAVCGLAGGAVFAMVLMMTLSLSAPQFWPSYKRAALPLPADAAPEMLYRLVETRVAGVKADDPARTLLPKLENAASPDPALFWQ
jgi:uncharacterized membrane protein required for colicin V production